LLEEKRAQRGQTCPQKGRGEGTLADWDEKKRRKKFTLPECEGGGGRGSLSWNRGKRKRGGKLFLAKPLHLPQGYRGGGGKENVPRKGRKWCAKRGMLFREKDRGAVRIRVERREEGGIRRGILQRKTLPEVGTGTPKNQKRKRMSTYLAGKQI